MRKLSLKRSLFIVLLSISTPIWAKGGNVPTPSMESFTLENGLNVVVKQDSRAPVAVVQIWYKVGSADEPKGITGISHALEHMMFQGSKNYPGDDFATTIAQYGGHNNAFTAEDYTAYYEEIAAEHIEVAFKAEADRMQYLLLEEESFASEIEVVKEERRLRVDDNPQMFAYEQFMAAANPVGPYHHPVIGWDEDLAKMAIDDLRKWYANWYAPNNATLVVVGDVDVATVKPLAEKYFASIPAKDIQKTTPVVAKNSTGPKRIKVERKANVPMLVMGFGAPSLSSADDQREAFALYVVSSVLDLGESSRFARELLRQEVATSASVSYDVLQRYTGQWVMVGIPSAQTNCEIVEQAFWAQIKALQDTLLEAAELNRVKTQLLAQEVFEKDSMSEQATLLGMLSALELPLTLADNFAEHISAVTAEEVQAVAKKYFQPGQATIAELVPLTMTEVG